MSKTNHYQHQKVAVFVDVQNLYYSAKNLYNTKVNFSEILKEAINGRQLMRAIAYVIKADVKDEQNFRDALTAIGYDVKIKDLQVFLGGNKKGDWDIGIAMDIVRIAPKVDAIVLVSGDGDFQELLMHVKSMGCRTEVIGFGKTSSSKLKDEAESFIDIDNKSKFLIHDRKRAQGREVKVSNSYKKPKEKPKVEIIEMDKDDKKEDKKKESKKSTKDTQKKSKDDKKNKPKKEEAKGILSKVKSTLFESI